MSVSDPHGEQDLRARERLRVLSRAVQTFSEASNQTPQLLEAIARLVADGIKDYCVVMLLSPDGKTLMPAAVHCSNAEALPGLRELLSTPLALDTQTIARGVIESGTPFIAPTVDPEAFRPPRATAGFFSLAKRFGLHSMLVVALKTHDRTLGQIVLGRFSSHPVPYDADDVELAEALANYAALALSNAQLLARARSDFSDLQAAQSRFSRLAESGLVGIVVGDTPARIIEINDTLLDMVGYTRDEILSGRVEWKSLTPPEWAGVDAKAVAQLASNGIGGLREKELVRKDGTRVPVLVGSAQLDGTQQIISFVVDLSERKEALAVIERLREERAVESKLAAIVSASDDAIVGKTLGGIVTSWNEGAHRLFGFAPGEMVGASIERIVPADREAEELDILRRVAEGEVVRLDTERRHKNGHHISVSVTVSPIRSPWGTVVGISKVARDITQRKRAEEALARAKEAAESANAELEAFSYSVAHDLRAPLRGMSGFASLLLDAYGEKFDGEARDWLNEIQLNALKMGALIDALLSLAKVTRTTLKREEVDLSALVRSSAGALAAAEPSRRVDVHADAPASARVDPNLARSLIENLVGNAWKFTSKAPAARIDFGVTWQSGGATFFVRDNGAGFDMAYAAKLFAPFQRLHSTSEFPGTGIGLATAHRIVRRHGGRIWAQSSVGGGATFFFTFVEPAGEAAS